MPSLARSVAVLVLAVAAAGCRNAPQTANAASPASPAAAGAASVVAEVDGRAITQKELDDRIASELYELRKNALDQLVLDRLLEKEAQRRGITTQELHKQEVEAKVPSPTPQEIEEVYRRNLDRVGGRSKEEVAPQIVQSLVQQRSAERVQAFRQSLRDNAKVRIALEQPRVEVPLPGDARATGPAAAPITLVEYSDYLCPYCQRAEENLQKVLARYQGKVKFVHRDFLIGRPRSLAVARGAQCAGDEDRFWEYRKDLLTTAGDWSDADLVSRAQRLGLKVDAFRACVVSEKHDKAILASTDEGHKLGVSGTPTFFINGRRLVGARPEESFREIIDVELEKAGRKG